MYRKHLVRAVTATGLAALLAVPQSLVAQAADHVVSPSDLQSAAVNASRTREQNISTLNAFLATEQAQKALQSAHMNPVEVKNAVAGLSDDEMAQLAKRANKAQADFAAGRLSDRDLIIILIAIAALILIIVAVH